MIGFITVVHILVTISLCALVLVQDSKGGGALGIGGSGSNSLLGATGAQSLAAKLTRYMAVIFAASCIALTYFLAHENKSVIDQLGTQSITTPAVPAATPAATTPEASKEAPSATPSTPESDKK